MLAHDLAHPEPGILFPALTMSDTNQRQNEFLRWLRAEADLWAVVRMKPESTVTAESAINTLGAVIGDKMNEMLSAPNNPDMQTKSYPQKPKTISEVCGQPPGSFQEHIKAMDLAAKLGLANPKGYITLTNDEVSTLFRAFPELEKLSAAALA